MECLKRGLQYKYNPAVRVQSVEALQSAAPQEALPWLRAAVRDEHPSVRFASCVAVGLLQDQVASQAVVACLHDPDPSVRLAAVFACHRLGDTGHTGELADQLLTNEDPLIRRNAALLLGLLDEQGAVKVLAKAMKDADAGVQNHALEAMAVLGVEEASQQLCFLANSGIGSQEVFAVNALARTGDARFLDTYRLKLDGAVHLETRLAAARALGLLGHGDGFELALRSLRSGRHGRVDPEDSPEAKRLRITTLAASALGAIGDPAALQALSDLIEDNDDPRVQVSAAKAIIEIVGRQSVWPEPPAANNPTGRR